VRVRTVCQRRRCLASRSTTRKPGRGDDDHALEATTALAMRSFTERGLRGCYVSGPGLASTILCVR
jgi:hypothetical protein